jgi:hypothetical protein
VARGRRNRTDGHYRPNNTDTSASGNRYTQGLVCQGFGTTYLDIIRVAWQDTLNQSVPSDLPSEPVREGGTPVSSLADSFPLGQDW